jgi:folate-binding protein YgfZ
VECIRSRIMPLNEHHLAAAKLSMRTSVDRAGADRPGAATADLSGGEPEFLAWGDGVDASDVIQTLATLGPVELEYAAIRTGVGLVDASQRGIVFVHGADTVDLLDRLMTQKMKSLQAGDTAAGFLLSRKGRIQADVLCTGLEDGVLLDVDRRDVDLVIAAIDGMTFAEDVVISQGADWYTLEAHGPGVAELFAAWNITLPDRLQSSTGAVADCEVRLTRCDTAGVPGVRVYLRRSDVVLVWEALHASDCQIRCRTVGWLAFNMARVEARTPWWHIDFGPTSLPHETGILADRVSFTKGCYPGQEVVARMENLGHPKQILRSIPMPDERLPISGGQVFQDESGSPGDPIGMITSSAPSPMRGNTTMVLAVIKWAHATIGGTVRCVAEGDFVSAVVEPVATSEEST